MIPQKESKYNYLKTIFSFINNFYLSESRNDLLENGIK